MDRNMPEVRPENPILSTHIHLLKNVKGVIQCGMGWRADEVDLWNQHGIKNQIYVEPVLSSFVFTREKALKYRSADTEIYCFWCAASSHDGEADFHLSVNLNSCSLLPFDENRPEVLKNDYMKGVTKVKTFQLDTLVSLVGVSLSKYNLLFLDVQGAEHLILWGAPTVLEHMDYVAMEISTVSIYDRSWLYEEYNEVMNNFGFKEIAKAEAYVTPEGDVYTYNVLYGR
jgi:FkbM family methyltransferase